MTASAWNPSGTVTQITGITIKAQVYTASAAQTHFTTTNQFTPGLNQLEVTKNGVWLDPAQITEDITGLGFTIAACAGGESIVARTFTPTTDAFQALATSASNSAAASAASAATAAAIQASITGLTGTVIGSGDLTFAGTGQKLLGTNQVTLQNFSITAANGNVVEATSAPNGSAFGLRNRIINGSCLVAQRGGVAVVNNAWTYGGCDRLAFGPIGFTTITGTIQQYSSYGSSSYFGQGAFISTTGSGTVQFQTRIESIDSKRLYSKTVTFYAYAYQNTGSTINAQANIYKANSVDNFGGQTLLNTGASTPCVSGVPTKVYVTIALGASDAINGLACSVIWPTVGAVTSKDFITSDWMLYEGSNVNEPFEQRPYGLELNLCQRYCELVSMHHYGYQVAGQAVSARGASKVSKRTTPIISNTSTFATETNYTHTNTIIDGAGEVIAYGTAASSALVEIQRQALLVAEL